MHTTQIKESILADYKNDKLTDERMDFLIAQANEQLSEIAQNKEIYNDFLKKVNTPESIDNIILWMLLMSNEDICCDYIDEFDKGFREIIPVGDLADLLLYVLYLKKVKANELEGYEYLLKYQHPGIDEMDQFAFTNALLYIQKSKEVAIEF